MKSEVGWVCGDSGRGSGGSWWLGTAGPGCGGRSAGSTADGAEEGPGGPLGRLVLAGVGLEAGVTGSL